MMRQEQSWMKGVVFGDRQRVHIMIEFSCMYCGKSVRTEESSAYKRVKCPACGHSIPVHKHTPGDALQSAPGTCTNALGDGQNWAGKSNKEIAKQLLTRPKPLSKEERERRAAKILLSPLLPRYDDFTLFALSLAFLLLVSINAELRQDLATAFSMKFGPRLPLLLLIAGFGMVLSLVNVFLQRKKSKFEKWPMLIFAVLVTAGTGIYVGWLMLERSQGWLVVFPAWNILNGALLLVLTYAGIIDTECIIEKTATFRQILITAITVPILLTTCLYIFDLHWAITFSIATAYTMNLHNVLHYLWSE